MNKSLSMNILRLSFLLVLVGFFAPIGCNLNGYQVAQGILGNTRELGNATLLAPIEDFYGYVLFGVFLFAFMGLLFTFLAKIHNNFLLGLICLAVSFVFLIIVVLKFIAIREEALTHFLVTLFRIKMRILIGGYSMGFGYLAGVVGFVLKIFKITE